MAFGIAAFAEAPFASLASTNATVAVSGLQQ